MAEVDRNLFPQAQREGKKWAQGREYDPYATEKAIDVALRTPENYFTVQHGVSLDQYEQMIATPKFRADYERHILRTLATDAADKGFSIITQPRVEYLPEENWMRMAQIRVGVRPYVPGDPNA